MAPAAGLAGPYRARSGVSARGRALPIVVASGLAMGVFAGLLVVRGTGEATDGTDDGPAAVAPGAASPSASPASAAVAPGSAPGAGDSPNRDPGAPGAPASTTAGASPGSPAQTGSSADSPAGRDVAVLSFSLHPRRAHVFIDGKEIEGTTAEVHLTGGTATVEVLVRARGHKPFTRSYTVTDDQEIEVSLHRDHRDEPSGPGGLLDIR
ncbi:MAG TPA: hypothetical protein VK698_12825 [Kofleriaceae bacterium]|nr:hypothetical protein [Kofleriaceae bacterium]